MRVTCTIIYYYYLPLVANGCCKLKDSCYEKLISRKILIVSAAFTRTSLWLKFINEMLLRHRRWIFVITSALYSVSYRFEQFVLFSIHLSNIQTVRTLPLLIISVISSSFFPLFSRDIEISSSFGNEIKICYPSQENPL